MARLLGKHPNFCDVFHREARQVPGSAGGTSDACKSSLVPSWVSSPHTGVVGKGQAGAVYS